MQADTALQVQACGSQAWRAGGRSGCGGAKTAASQLDEDLENLTSELEDLSPTPMKIAGLTRTFQPARHAPSRSHRLRIDEDRVAREDARRVLARAMWKNRRGGETPGKHRKQPGTRRLT